MYVCVVRLITLKQFLNAMKRCAVDISDSDGLRLMLRFDTEDTQRFDTLPLIKFMRRLTYPDPGQQQQQQQQDGGGVLESSVHRRNESSSRDDEQSGQGGSSAESFAWKTLKKQVEARLGQGDTPNEVFSLFDSFNRGNIDLLSLQKGTEELGQGGLLQINELSIHTYILTYHTLLTHALILMSIYIRTYTYIRTYIHTYTHAW